MSTETTELLVQAFSSQLEAVERDNPGLLREAMATREDDAKRSRDESSVEELVAREAVEAVLAPVVRARALGDTFNTRDVIDRLGITRQAIALRVRHHSLLALPARRSRRYPIWQFGAHDVLAIVPTILRRWYQAEPEVEPVTIAQWAMSPVRLGDGGDVIPAQLIAKDEADELVLTLLDDVIARRTQ